MGNRPKPPIEIPLVLPLEGCWEIEEARLDSVLFLRTISHAFPEATTTYLEGTSIEPDVIAMYQRFAQPGKYLPQAQTLWPTAQQFRCVFSPQFCAELAAFADRHAEPELVDHLFLYAEDKPILEWPDAFDNYLWISSSIPEERVANFARVFGLSFRHRLAIPS